MRHWHIKAIFVVVFLLFVGLISTLLPSFVRKNADANTDTRTIFFEDFSGLQEGIIGPNLIWEGNNNYWGVVKAGDNNILWSDYLNTPYLDDVENSVVSIATDMSDAKIVSASIDFNISCDTEPRVSEWTDYVSLSILKDGVWTEINKYDETLFGDELFHNVSENITDYKSDNLKFKFTWKTNGVNNEHMGCSIWPIQIKAIYSVIGTNDTAYKEIDTYDDKVKITGSKSNVVSVYLDNNSSPIAGFDVLSWQVSLSADLESKTYVINYRNSEGETEAKTIKIKKHKMADINGDGSINIRDFAILLRYWGCNQTEYPMAKLGADKSKKVGVDDFAVMMAKWGK
ncbi:MAG: dockerin type I domain-containing protein [Patescibacteria group bacterium]